ncbi:hypothetical protein [Nocardiopsis coralliicola]
MIAPDLLVADYRAGRTYAVADGAVRPLGTAVLAEHAGVLALPRNGAGTDSWAFVDDRCGALVASDFTQERRFPVAIPAEHLACDPSGRYVAVTTGLGANAAPWSDVVSLVDRDAGTAVRFRSRTGEPGVLIAADQAGGEPAVLLRHRGPGAIEAIPLSRCLDAPAHVPPLSGAVLEDIADDGHGDVFDPRSAIAATATGRGLERFVVDGGVPRALGPVAWPAPGRAYYLRLAPEGGRAVGVVRGGPPAPQRWTEWTNHLVDIELATGRARAVPLPPGLAFRFALGGTRAALATIHPDGDGLTVVERAGEHLRVLARTPLPPMTRPPSPGRLPWDAAGGAPAQRRAVALDPTGTTAAVTRGGDGQLHLLSDAGSTTLAVPTPLDEGGYLYWHGSSADTIGR